MPRPEPANRAGADSGRKALRAARKAAARERRGLRAERYDSRFAPWAFAAAGAAASVALLFQQSLAVKALLFALFLSTALASGKKVSLLPTVFVTAGIVAANLLVPVGRVLWKAGPITVTETALLDGLGKALTFEGLIYISKASIRPGLRLPGRFGAIVAAAFLYYDRIVEYKGTIRVQSLYEDIDAMMLQVWDSTARPGNVAEAPRANASSGYILVAVAIILSATALWVGHSLSR